MKELLLVVVMAVIFIIGYCAMEGIDRFLGISRRARLEEPVRERDSFAGRVCSRNQAEVRKRRLGSWSLRPLAWLMAGTAHSGKCIKNVI